LGTSYLDAARRGVHTPGRYLLGTLVALVYWQVLGACVALLLGWRFAPAGTSLAEVGRLLERPGWFGPLRGFILLNVVPPFLILGLLLAVAGFHRRPLLTLVTAAPRISWKRIAQGFTVWFGLSCLCAFVEYLIAPETYAFRWDPLVFGAFLPLALVLTPVQTTAEELFFRGYLVQGLSLVSRRPLFLAGVSGALFALPHLANPEMEANPVALALSYFLTGVLLTLCALRDGSLELAIGAHAANNLFGAVVLTFSGSIFQTPALVFTSRFDPIWSLITLLAMAALFYAVLLTRGRTQPPGAAAGAPGDMREPPGGMPELPAGTPGPRGDPHHPPGAGLAPGSAIDEPEHPG
jgi:membrane protease YdiL (CAAX protease family)